MSFCKRNSIEIKFFVVFSLFAAVLTQVSVSPLIYPDEAGYIGWVYKLICGNGSGLRYLPGYSFLITPAFVATSGIKPAYMLLVLINSVMYGGFSAMCLKVCRGIDLPEPYITAIAVSLYPSFVLYANLAMAEVLLTLLFVMLLYFIQKLSDDLSSYKLWLAVIFITGYACFTHSRAIALLPAVFVSLAVPVWKHGSKLVKGIFFAVCAVGVLSAVSLTVYLFLHSETVNAAHMVSQIGKLLTIWGFGNFAATLLSQFSYLAMSTFGFVIIGIYYAVQAVRENKNRTSALFSVAAFVFSALVSAVFMYHHERPDHIIYGRYNEYVLAGVLLFGISGFLKNGAKLKLAVCGVVSAAVTAVFYSKPLSEFGGNMCHTWGIYLYRAFLKNFSYISAALIFLVFSAVIFRMKKPKYSIVALCVMFLITTIYTQYDYFYKGADLRHETPQLAKLLEGETKVSADVIEGDSMVYPWEYYNYTVYNPKLSIEEGARFRLSQTRIPNMRLAGKEKHSDIYLYTDDETVPQVDEKNEPNAKLSVSATSRYNIAVTYENSGDPWLCLDAAEDMKSAVRAGMRVYQDNNLIADVRRDFSDNVYGKAGVIFDFPYDDGEYTVIFETVREFMFRGNELAFSVVAKDGALSLEECNIKKDAAFSEFDPLEIKGAEGFYRYYVTTSGVKIPGLRLAGSYLTIETYGEHDELEVEVFADGKKLDFLGYEDSKYIYAFSGEIETLEIRSSTYKYCDNFMSFLTTESNFKPIDYFVRGMKKIFNIRLDHREYGVDIKKICIN